MVALVAEDFGGMTRTACTVLRKLADKTKNPKHRDGTVYGDFSTRSFHAHHAAALSATIHSGVAAAVVKGILAHESRLAGGPGGAP